MTAAAARLAQTGLDVETALLAGDPGNGTMAEALLGSVSGALVRRADRPVLVAKHRAVRAQRAA